MKKYIIVQTIKNGKVEGTAEYVTTFNSPEFISREFEITTDNVFLINLSLTESSEIVDKLSLTEEEKKDALFNSNIFISQEVADAKRLKFDLNTPVSLSSYIATYLANRNRHSHVSRLPHPLDVYPTLAGFGPIGGSPLFNHVSHRDLTNVTSGINGFYNSVRKHTSVVFNGNKLFFTNPNKPDRNIDTNEKIPELRGETLYSLRRNYRSFTMPLLSEIAYKLDYNIGVYTGDPVSTYEFVVNEEVARKIVSILISRAVPLGSAKELTPEKEFSRVFNLCFFKLNKPVYVMVDKEILTFGVDVKAPAELQSINNANPKDIINTFEDIGVSTNHEMYNSIKKIQNACGKSMASNRWENELVEYIPMITESYANWCDDTYIRNNLGTRKEAVSGDFNVDEPVLSSVEENHVENNVYKLFVDRFAIDIINNRPLVIASKRSFGYTNVNEPEYVEYMNYRFKDKVLFVFDRNIIPDDFEWIKNKVSECYDIKDAGDVELIACTKGFMNGLEKERVSMAYKLLGNDILAAWNEVKKMRLETKESETDKSIDESIKALLAISGLFASIYNSQPNLLKKVDCAVKPKDSGDEIGTSKIVTLSNGKEVEVKVLTPEDLERMLCFPNNDTFGTKCCQDTKEASVPKEERVTRQSKSVDKVLEILRDKTLDVIVMNTGCNISIDNGTINVDSDESFNGDISSLIHGDVKYYYIDSDHKEFKKVKNRLPNRLSDSRLTGYLLSTNAFDSLIRNSPPFVTTDFIEVNGNDAKSALFYNMTVTPIPKPGEAIKVSDVVTILDNDLVMFFKYKCLEDRETGLKKINNGIPLISVSSADNTDEDMIKFHKVCSDFVRSMGKKAIVDGKYYVSEDFFRTQFKDVDVIGYMLFPIELKFSN